MQLLALSGSLRAASTNTALLRAAARLAPPGVSIGLYDGMGRLPIFNPDADLDPAPAAVAELRKALQDCAGLLIASPEYAHGVPGGLKNLLDWVVASGELVDKPVALWHASPRSAISRAALREVLQTMSACVIDAAGATIPLMGQTRPEMAATLADPALEAQMRATLEVFRQAILSPPANQHVVEIG